MYDGKSVDQKSEKRRAKSEKRSLHRTARHGFAMEKQERAAPVGMTGKTEGRKAGGTPALRTCS
jgi:hypothetical protein